MFVARRGLREKREVARELRLHPTPEEKLLWQRVRRNQVGGQHFRRQHVLDGFIVDFYCHAVQLVVELDGKHHAAQKEADREREAVLRGLGMTVLRFANWEVRETLEHVVRRIGEEVSSALSSLTPCPPSPKRGRGNAASMPEAGKGERNAVGARSGQGVRGL